jgi:hypothetical protein
MAAVVQHRELSGAFSDEAKWQECWTHLSSDDCSINTLRIYHNSQQQLFETAQALLHNSTVTQFEVGVVDGLDAAHGLSDLLKVSCIRRHAACITAGKQELELMLCLFWVSGVALFNLCYCTFLSCRSTKPYRH